MLKEDVICCNLFAARLNAGFIFKDVLTLQEHISQQIVIELHSFGFTAGRSTGRQLAKLF